ncbi:MAG: hypothetical protein CFE45_02435 [Burkholderiales bacterium PBB5]|nr:MAG: hypothetical protein CFE45_02435 [Burkholderiales bacterium PBB5]
MTMSLTAGTRRIALAVTLAAVSALTACSTTQQVTLAKTTLARPLQSVAQVAAAGNSEPKGVDALVSYVDVWRWDLVMYLKNLTIRITDAETGDLIAMGQWSDSALHGFRDAKLVTEGLLGEVLAKVRGATKP